MEHYWLKWHHQNGANKPFGFGFDLDEKNTKYRHYHATLKRNMNNMSLRDGQFDINPIRVAIDKETLHTDISVYKLPSKKSKNDKN